MKANSDSMNALVASLNDTYLVIWDLSNGVYGTLYNAADHSLIGNQSMKV